MAKYSFTLIFKTNGFNLIISIIFYCKGAQGVHQYRMWLNFTNPWLDFQGFCCLLFKMPPLCFVSQLAPKTQKFSCVIWSLVLASTSCRVSKAHCDPGQVRAVTEEESILKIISQWQKCANRMFLERLHYLSHYRIRIRIIRIGIRWFWIWYQIR